MNHNDLPPFKQNDWEAPDVTVEVLDSGVQLVSSPRQPLPVASNLIKVLARAADRYADRTFLAQRDNNQSWVRLSFKEADERSSRIAHWLLSLGLPEATPVMILSENSLEHALFMLGAMKARLPVVPVSPGYSLMSHDHGKLRRIHSLVKPGVVFVQDTERYAKALQALELGDTALVTVEGHSEGGSITPFARLEADEAGHEVQASCDAIQPDTVAKILFTSGSTGEPKGVINTHHNLCFTQSALGTLVHLDADNRPPILLDWLPWHHTFGGNQNFNRSLRYGGALYIDDGKPLPGLFERTLRNLREIQVTTFSTVPAAFGALLDALERDKPLRENFFSKLDWISYGGSDMPQHIFDRIQKVAIEATGKRMPVITAMGSTETSAIITATHWPSEQMGNIGLPVPGTTVKLIPLGDKFEMRVKGPQVMQGYFHDDARTQETFDEEGFFRTGDAVRWIDAAHPHLGLKFAGRVAEDFKLSSGTWVHTGSLRSAAASALAPLITDLVMTGQDRDCIGLMAWPNETGIRALLDDSETPLSALMGSTALHQLLSQRLEQHNQVHNHTSMRIKRLLLLTEPPSLDHNEITDKRYINQLAVLERRADQVERLYATSPDPDVICL
ncbi:MAG: feruloyl-CoA synthase [Halomonas sp.]|nr:feruloyl-CoA synthase [Halomonas sp.]MCC5902274.1 feruloyl-CoA synthase [Halomonas sp.]